MNKSHMRQRRRWASTARYLEVMVGRAIREARQARGWTQAQLGGRIGASQSLISRYECSTAYRPRLDVVAAAFDALGVSMRLDADAPFLTRRRRQRDRAHAFVTAYLLRRLPRDWLARAEAEIGTVRHPGWIDVVAFHPATGTLLVVEIKTELDDAGETLRVLSWYAREVPDLMRGFGWRVRRVVRLLVFLETAETDRRLAEAGDLFEVALPARAEEIARLLADPTAGLTAHGVDVAGGLALVDPLSRRRRWLRDPKIRGRRAAASYADYAAFVRAIEGRRLPARPRATA